MKHKYNSNNYKLVSNKNEWKHKYIEKNPEESSLFIYKSLEIEKYVNQFFQSYGLIVNQCNLQFFNNKLNVYITYYTTHKTKYIIKKFNTFQKIKVKRKLNNKYKNNKYKNNKYKKNKYKKNQIKLLKKKRLNLIKYFKIKPKINKILFFNQFFFNNFINILSESLNTITNNKYNIIIITKKLNKGLSLRLTNKQVKIFKNIIFKLRTYKKRNHNLFTETINILSIIVTQRKTTQLLAKYIAFQISVLEKSRKHKFLFNFLKKTLFFLIKSKISKINGIKIVINGRINKSKRTKHKIINLGYIPLQTVKIKLNYYKTTAFTQNGTFGIKIWICEKKI